MPIRALHGDSVQARRSHVEEMPAGCRVVDVRRCQPHDCIAIHDDIVIRKRSGEVVEREPIAVTGPRIDRERTENRIDIAACAGNGIRRDQHRVVAALADDPRETAGARGLQLERSISGASHERRVAVCTRRGNVERVCRGRRIHTTGHGCIRIRRRARHVDRTRSQCRVRIHRFEVDVAHLRAARAIQGTRRQPVRVPTGVALVVEVHRIADRHRVIVGDRARNTARIQRGRWSRVVRQSIDRKETPDLRQRVGGADVESIVSAAAQDLRRATEQRADDVDNERREIAAFQLNPVDRAVGVGKVTRGDGVVDGGRSEPRDAVIRQRHILVGCAAEIADPQAVLDAGTGRYRQRPKDAVEIPGGRGHVPRRATHIDGVRIAGRLNRRRGNGTIRTLHVVSKSRYPAEQIEEFDAARAVIDPLRADADARRCQLRGAGCGDIQRVDAARSGIGHVDGAGARTGER